MSQTVAHRQLPVREIASQTLDCDYFQRGVCRSCTELETPYPEQVRAKQQRAENLIDAHVWEEPFESRPQAFRNKVKLVVTGSVREPKLGILGGDGRGVDLRNCPLPTPGIRGAIPEIARFITACQLEPYSPATDRGVLKYVIITESDDGELMVRFVVRRRGVQGVVFKRKDELLAALPTIKVLTLNVQPEHKAIIEGAEEIIVNDADLLPMQVNCDLHGSSFSAGAKLTLNLRPQSFFQTNTDAAGELYRTAVHWLGNVNHVWDLYCGVGGFALALAAGRTHGSIVGVETSEQAVQAANQTAQQMGLADRVRFFTGDATEWVANVTERAEVGAGAIPEANVAMPDAVVVNPPRRGLSTQLCQWLNESGISHVLYSSCNMDSLARDVALMPNYTVARGKVVDMFPHTKHCEVIVMLDREQSS
ncbi:methyltransferase domain-containing protein [Arcanobacterium pinnipediorum]|uniref:Methyltransferase domain-containing protein n=1 Tax=Arcanobacterium pinnipediorum TaxID=1503041 RepID=A0ABY5AGR5_9ACTO|nr:methyltransferase domain-containing protein [Arcanobacterium pinnipediorum]USR79384.1 methyltransferase domain-containing protein [Arcanobacterium pinnipediorum]